MGNGGEIFTERTCVKYKPRASSVKSTIPEKSCKHIPNFSRKENKIKKNTQDCTVKEEFFRPSLRISLEWSCTKRIRELLEKCPGLV